MQRMQAELAHTDLLQPLDPGCRHRNLEMSQAPQVADHRQRIQLLLVRYEVKQQDFQTGAAAQQLRKLLRFAYQRFSVLLLEVVSAVT
eukprot:CAMPEP_0204307324 /NCGR_PEP_ID=MMETSP0468-20130131/85872_1 /ASSEMBLY_ACC=CAM_ASM_000383 /TAXON_ID=2969 /ORGANISM="Oxyrrhis marina" /LENGTH=87 /DNA_ID=CAMNT_0051286679 /DNA_START=617 /DNA_END=880 /DNA_ORIENTATION=-